MRYASLTVLAGLVSLATARITAFAVPKTIKPGDQFDTILMGFNYIQTVDEIAAAFGVAPGDGWEGSLGTLINSVYLGPNKSNEVANFTFPTTVPTDMEEGAATFTASLFQLYGAANSPTHHQYNVSITLGKETSDDEYVRSLP